MVHTRDSTASQAPEPERPPVASNPSAGAGALKGALQGKTFDAQVQMLSPAPARSAVQLMAVQRATVSKANKDGPYGWTSSYDVDFDDKVKECRIAVKVKLTPADATVTEDDSKKIKGFAQAQFQKYWDNKFTITDKGSGTKYKLRLTLAFVDAAEHVAVTLHPGEGRDNRRNWYVKQIDNITLAHELGHQLGLKDEYVDPGVPDRADATKPGAHSDHSIMGDYYSEGEGKAEAKLRHGQTFAGDIAGATGRTLEAGI